uniref:Putative interferon alpha-inducible protein n=1 Tax=Rhipicephalus pulchellus TaxID=72859 RepID=L7M2U7_RHIPC
MVDRRTVIIGAAATVGAAAAMVAAPVALSAVGFGKVGVTAGSTAAAINSSIGTIAKGSLYSLCQHWGAVGLPAALKATAAAGGAGLAGSAAYVGTSAPVQFVASKTVGGVKAVANAVAPAVPVACSVASKTGSCLVGATKLMKTGAVAAGTHLGILGTGTPTDGSVKPPAARL